MVAQSAAPKRKPGERGPAIPVFSRVVARNMYLNDCLPIAAIATRLGLTEGTVRAMASNEGWVSERKKREAALIQKSDKQNEALSTELIEAIATQSEELALGGINEARKELTSGSEQAARNFQAWSAGVKNFASVAKLVRDPNGSGMERGSTVNLFMIRAGDALNNAKPVSQVTEIESKA